MAFFKKKTQEAQQPEEKRDTVAQKSEIPDAVKKALDETLPTLEGNLEKFEELYPNPASLAEDIKEHGLLNPILVRVLGLAAGMKF